ncbi:MAG: FHA domain-containing protein, partial [Acidobacteria bacterium]
MRMYLFLLAPLVMLGLDGQDTQAEERSPGKDYASQIQAARKAKDARFQDEKSSPLGVVALIKLDNPRMTIGSSPDADLTLTGRSVKPIHAVVVREDLGNKTGRWLLRPVGGKIIFEQTRKPVESAELRKGDRYLVGKRIVYLDQLGSLGEVLRAFDP